MHKALVCPCGIKAHTFTLTIHEQVHRQHEMEDIYVSFFFFTWLVRQWHSVVPCGFLYQGCREPHGEELKFEKRKMDRQPSCQPWCRRMYNIGHSMYTSSYQQIWTMSILMSEQGLTWSLSICLLFSTKSKKKNNNRHFSILQFPVPPHNTVLPFFDASEAKRWHHALKRCVNVLKPDSCFPSKLRWNFTGLK